MRAAVFLAQKMGTGMGTGKVLQRPVPVGKTAPGVKGRNEFRRYFADKLLKTSP